MSDADAATEPAREEHEREGSDDELVEADMLVEDVSIDGMCGVY